VVLLMDHPGFLLLPVDIKRVYCCVSELFGSLVFVVHICRVGSTFAAIAYIGKNFTFARAVLDRVHVYPFESMYRIGLIYSCDCDARALRQAYFYLIQTGGVGENRGCASLPFPFPLLPYTIPSLLPILEPSSPTLLLPSLPFYLPSFFPSPVNGGPGV
jgi:hypothetical protein